VGVSVVVVLNVRLASKIGGEQGEILDRSDPCVCAPLAVRPFELGVQEAGGSGWIAACERCEPRGIGGRRRDSG